MSGAVAWLDLHLHGMQMVTGLILTSGNIFSWSSVMKFSPFHWFKKGSCQLLAKECALKTGNCLGGMPWNSVDRLTDWAWNDLKSVKRAVKHPHNNNNIPTYPLILKLIGIQQTKRYFQEWPEGPWNTVAIIIKYMYEHEYYHLPWGVGRTSHES